MSKRRQPWVKSDMPRDSEHLEGASSRYAARVKPDPHGGFEWSVWIGPPGRRVLHAADSVKTRAAAKKRAAQYLNAVDRR